MYKPHVCQFCKRTFSNLGGKGSHVPYCPENPNKVKRVRSHKAGRPKGMPAWNKGLKGDVRLAKPNLKGKRFGASKNGHSLQTKKKLSEIAKSRGLGGYVQGSGRGKKGWFQGIFCDSSWELAYVIFSRDFGVNVSRNLEFRHYTWNGITRKYLPDFIADGKLIEIKGYKTDQWAAKLSANPDITVLYHEEMKHILEYVILTYGKDFVRLYQTTTDRSSNG